MEVRQWKANYVRGMSQLNFASLREKIPKALTREKTKGIGWTIPWVSKQTDKAIYYTNVLNTQLVHVTVYITTGRRREEQMQSDEEKRAVSTQLHHNI